MRVVCDLCCRNYRTWILVATYGFSFGVELTVNNNLASYLNSQFGKSLLAAGNFSSVFGLMNLIARPTGDYSGAAWPSCSLFSANRTAAHGHLMLRLRDVKCCHESVGLQHLMRRS